jgi:hypothetical protein
MSDLIRREDALDRFDGTPHVPVQMSYEEAREAILALPAVTVQAQIDAAAAAERERCAKVAETCPDSHWGPWVAAVIRKGEQP